jgi:hypothetical protein
LLGVLAVALSGCVRASTTSYRALAPKPTPEAVEIFSERLPGREFEEVGLIEVTGPGAASYGKLVKRAQQEGAKLGADAIIVSRRPIRGASAVALDGPLPMVAASEDEVPRLWVVAIIWKDNGGPR